MPRPCQKRRARVAAQKGANIKPVQPPPLPKSKPPARGTPQRGRGRGRGRGGRGGNFGGRPTRGQSSQMGGAEEFRSFVEAQRSGNQFGALNNNARAGGGRSLDRFVLDNSDSGLEEGELTDDGSDMDDSMSELDTDDSEGDMMINLGEIRPQKGKPIRAQVMFTALEAASVYNNMHQAGFPLSARRMTRFDASGELVEVEIQAVYTNGHNMTQNSHMHFTRGSGVPMQTRSAGDHSTRSSAYVSDFPRGQQSAANNPQKAPPPPRLPEHDFVKDYVFDWGRYKNSHISDVPESYLRTIGGQSFVFDGRHPGLKEAFDHHRPELRHATVDVQPPAQAPVQAPRRTRSSVSSFEKFRFPKGAAKGKRLDEVDENYLKTLEGMPTIIHSWPGLKEALADFNEKTGRQGKVFPEHVESRLP